MITAILISTSLVIAVIIFSLCVAAGEADKIAEEDSYKWARLWNEKWDCDNNCKYCTEINFCKVKDVVK